MLKHCLSLKTFIPNFVAFLVSIGIVISCIHKMSFSVTSAKQEFMLTIVSLSTSWEVDNVHYSEDSEPIRLFEIPTSPSLYMLMIITVATSESTCDYALLACAKRNKVREKGRKLYLLSCT